MKERTAFRLFGDERGGRRSRGRGREGRGRREGGALLIQSDNEGAIESSYRIVAGMLRELQWQDARTQIRVMPPNRATSTPYS